MLDKIQEECITMLIQGESITEISRVLDKSRSTIYNWLKDDEFKAELNRTQQLIRTQGNSYILNKYQTYLANIDRIANSKDGDMRSILQANQYLCNKIDGTPTQKIEQINTSENSNSLTSEDLTKEFDAFDEVEGSEEKVE